MNQLLSLSRFKRVLVTGAQRSGTTIAARIVAYETGFTYIDEEDFNVHEKNRFAAMCEREQIVIHCPAMARWVHEYGSGEDTAVLWVVRALSDILRSQARIGWDEAPEKLKYRSVTKSVDKPVAQIKQAYWRGYQKNVIPNALEVHYGDLVGHPLWVPKGERGEFEPRQWKV